MQPSEVIIECQKMKAHVDDAGLFLVLGFVVLLIQQLLFTISTHEPGPDDRDDPTQ